MPVARIKRMRRALADRIRPRGLVFHHVPKCGGTSVGMSIRRKYLLSQAGIVPAPSFHTVGSLVASDDRLAILQHAKEFREKMLLYHLHCGVKCVSAHVRFSTVAYREFNETHGFVTILRDPVERYISHFFYGAGRDGHMSIDEPLEKFVETEEGRLYGAAYCDYFSGLGAFDDYRTAEAIGRAKKNLGLFAVVGFLDDLPGFSNGIRQQFGFRPRIGHLNQGQTARAGTGREIPRPILDRIEMLCAPDREIYEHARKEFSS